MSAPRAAPVVGLMRVGSRVTTMKGIAMTTNDNENDSGQNELLRGVALLGAAALMTSDVALRERIDQARVLLGTEPPVDRFDRDLSIARLREHYGERFGDGIDQRSDAFIGGAISVLLGQRRAKHARARAQASRAGAARASGVSCTSSHDDARPGTGTTQSAPIAARAAMIARNRGTAPPMSVKQAYDQMVARNRGQSGS